jgi:hypothetical protein
MSEACSPPPNAKPARRRAGKVERFVAKLLHAGVTGSDTLADGAN